MHFLHRYRADGPPAGNLSDIVGAAASGSTGDVWWGLTYFDLARVLPLRIERDRGWALERAWERVLKPDEAQRTMGQWRQGTDAGWRPALAFNSMAVETGERVVLATYALPSTSPAKSLGDVTGNRDIDVVTAARLSASFPYVTPFARAAGDSIELHLADGGYWDNHGVATALEWLDETSAQLDGRPVILIRIPPPTTIPDRPRNRTWVWQLTAPISGLDSMRTNSQKVRNDHEMARYTEPTFPPVDFLAKGTPSLSWHVSLAERCQIERTWRRAYETELKQVEKILGPRKAGQMPGPPAECMP